jgi:hypothetical protein
MGALKGHGFSRAETGTRTTGFAAEGQLHEWTFLPVVCEPTATVKCGIFTSGVLSKDEDQQRK